MSTNEWINAFYFLITILSLLGNTVALLVTIAPYTARKLPRHATTVELIQPVETRIPDDLQKIFIAIVTLTGIELFILLVHIFYHGSECFEIYTGQPTGQKVTINKTEIIIGRTCCGDDTYIHWINPPEVKYGRFLYLFLGLVSLVQTALLATVVIQYNSIVTSKGKTVLGALSGFSAWTGVVSLLYYWRYRVVGVRMAKGATTTPQHNEFGKTAPWF